MLLCIMVNMLKNKRNPEVLAGVFLIIGSISIGATYLTKIEYLSFFSSLSDDFEYLTDNAFILQLNSILWIISAVVMIMTSASLLVAMKAHGEITAYTTSFFFILTSFLFCINGIKGLSIMEMLAYQESKVLDIIENEYIRTNILNLTNERAINLRISNTMAGFGLVFLGLFGAKTRKIPYVYILLCLTGGGIIPIVTTFFPESILNEIGLLILLFVFFLLGIRLAFKGFVLKKRKKPEKNKE